MRLAIQIFLLLFSSICFAETISCPSKLDDVQQYANPITGWVVTEDNPHRHSLHGVDIQFSVSTDSGVFWSSEIPDNYQEMERKCDSLKVDETCKTEAIWVLDPKTEYRLECSYFRTSIVLQKSLKGYKICKQKLINWQTNGVTCIQ